MQTQGKTSKATSIVRKAVQFEYAVLRTPLTLLDDTLAARLGERSKVRATLHRGLGTLDAAAGRFLAQPSAPASDPGAKAGTKPTAKSAAKPGAKAQPKPGPASDVVDQPTGGAEHEDAFDIGQVADEVPTPGETLPPEDVEQIEHVTEELLEEQAEKPLAGELADDDELRRVQAALQAKHLVEENEQQHHG